MQTVLQFWFLASGPWAWEHYIRSVAAFDSRIALTTTLKNLDKPLFQDYTWQGRLIGFFFRLVRICFGLVLYGLTAVVYAVAYLIWLAFPFICVLAIVGSLFGATSQPHSQAQPATSYSQFE